MTKQHKAHVATVIALVLVVVAGLALRSWRTVAQDAPTPQEAVYAMLTAARNGNVATYLALYTGSLQESLRESARESGDSGFAKYLRDSNAAVKGLAVGEPQTLGDTEVTVRVEYVYGDHNEVQSMRLARIGREWKIAGVDGAGRTESLVPYGTRIK